MAQVQSVAKAKAVKGQLSRGLHTHAHTHTRTHAHTHTHTHTVIDFLLHIVESCSSDTLKNAIKTLQDMEVLVPVRNGDTGNQTLRVGNSNRLVDIIKQLTLLRTCV